MSPDSGGEAAAFRAATGVSRETLDRLRIYAELLTCWNARVNLVGRATIPELWTRHMLDSAQLWPLLPNASAARARVLVDMGSGAGFPGLVLAIMGAGKVHLIESVQKKTAFLRTVARETDAPVQVHACRIADAPAMPADVITARALAPLQTLLGHAVRFAHPETVALFPKGRTAEQELTAARKAWNIRVAEHPSRTDPAGRILEIAGIG